MTTFSDSRFAETDLEHVLQHAAGDLKALAGRRLFITGGTGFFGRWLLETMLAANRKWRAGMEATVLSRDPAAFAGRAPHLAGAPGIRWVKGNVVDFTVEQVAFALGEDPGRLAYDAIIHLATEADNERTLADPAAAAEVITGGTRRALEFAAATGARRFLFTGSGVVYGRQPEGAAGLTEDAPVDPGASVRPAYALSGRAKLAAEELCALYRARAGLETIIARCFTFAGPGLPLEGKFAFGNFLADAISGRDIMVAGDGTPVRSYLYAADLAVWLWAMLGRGQPGRVYNLGSERPISIRELAELFARVAGKGARVRLGRAPDPGVPPDRYVPSTRRAREKLGLVERIGLEDAVRRTVAWAQGGKRKF